MISGQEDALRAAALDEIVALATRDGDLDLESVLASESDPRIWASMASTLPFLSERRTVVVRRLLRLLDLEPFEAAVAKEWRTLPPTALIVLVADDEPGDDDKHQKIERARKKWEALVRSCNGVVVECKIEADKVKAVLKAELQRAAKRMPESALNVLIEMCGGSYSRCREELEKLILFAGNEEQIRDADVRKLVVPAREWKVNNLIRAALDGNATEALSQLRVLFASNEKIETAAFSKLFPYMRSNLRQAWQARLFLDAKATIAHPPQSVLEQLPEGGSILKDPDWKQRLAFRAARGVTLAQIAACMQIVANADARLKGLEDGFDSYDTLERAVLEMVHAVKPALASA